MIIYFKSVYGQSFQDLTMQAYGNLDLFVRFCIDNLITNTTISTDNQQTPLTLWYDTNLIEDVKNKRKYKTAFIQDSDNRWHDDYYDEWHD